MTSGHRDTPISAATTVSQEVPSGRRYGAPRPVSMAVDSPVGGWAAAFPPPPPLFNRVVSAGQVPNSHTPENVADGIHQPRPIGHHTNGSIRPPTAVRAASTGHVTMSQESSRNASRPSSNSSPAAQLYEQHVPPPPPGPPPASSRSPSVSSAGGSHGLHPAARPQSRQPSLLGRSPELVATSGDEVANIHSAARTRAPPPLDLVTVQGSSSDEGIGSGDPRRLSALVRSPALRDPSGSGIRERRNNSRQRRDPSVDAQSATSTSSNPWADALESAVRPSNLVLSSPSTPSSSRTRQRAARLTPTSALSVKSDDGMALRDDATKPSSSRSASTHSTLKSESIMSGSRVAHTPPSSAQHISFNVYPDTDGHLPPRGLPTPPTGGFPQERKPFPLRSRDASLDRPVSHLLHLPNEASEIPSLLSPRRPPVELTEQQKRSVEIAVERHRSFLEQEVLAHTEEDKLQLFAEFVVTESQIRRRQWNDVWKKEYSDIGDLKTRLFELPKEKAAARPSSSAKTDSPVVSSPYPLSLNTRGGPKSQNSPGRPESTWWSNYQPCLSPIVSLQEDEMSSRGRPPSRWWESGTGSGSDGRARKVDRSKRESKYMGLPREIREAMQWGDIAEESNEGLGLSISNPGKAAAAPYAGLGANEYPPEKVGWHESSSLQGESMDPPPLYPPGHASLPSKIDMSRLITLPPPYPRHYPAVNNSHPDLVSYRATVRSVTELGELQSARERYKAQLETIDKENKERLSEIRKQFRANINTQLGEGSITYAEAAEAEVAFKAEEARLIKDKVQAEFDCHENLVLKPMHQLISDRITKTTAAIDDLRDTIAEAAKHRTPNQAQEEGDEMPELLEQLTQLKWLFEARETLHRELFTLLSDRNAKYKQIVILPYQQSGNNEKIRSTSAFFARDAHDRQQKYRNEVLTRSRELQDIVDRNVSEAVELQLSAFWDIAPALSAVLSKIPDDLRSFELDIPTSELEENPSYAVYPLQYLWSLLSHAEKSSYQFIESQTNLFCLSHEVKSGVMRVTASLSAAQRAAQKAASPTSSSAAPSPSDAGPLSPLITDEEARARVAREEEALTSQLKDMVRTVEGQWAEALGSQMQAVKERVRAELEQMGGWDEIEQD